MFKNSQFPLRIWELVLFILIFIIGSIGNVTVLIVITKSKRINRTAPFNVYLFTLALVDLFVSIFALPDYVLRTNIYDPPAESYMCKLVIGGLLPFWLLEVSVYLLVAICLERRKAILDPFSTLKQQSLIFSLFIIFCLFLLGGFNEIPTWYGIYYNKENSTSGNFCSYKYYPVTTVLFHFVSFFLQCFVPLVIFFVSFYQIQTQLRKTETELKSSLTNYNESTYQKMRNQLLRKKEITIATMRMVVLAFFICITPNEVLYMLFQFVSSSELEMNSSLFQVTVLLRYSNSCLNPILYSYRSEEFQKHFFEVFAKTSHWICCKIGRRRTATRSICYNSL